MAPQPNVLPLILIVITLIMTLETITAASLQLFGGFLDSFALFNMLPMLGRMPDLGPLLVELLLLNGIVYMGGAYVLENLALPALAMRMGTGSFYKITLVALKFIWTVPGYAACFFINNRLYEKMAKVIARYENLEEGSEDDGREGARAEGRETLKDHKTDQDDMYRSLFLGAHLGLYALLPLFVPPWLNWCLAWPSMAALYSLYAYEYHWRRKKWSFSQRLAQVEGNIFYHLGFGATSSLVTMLLSTVMGLGWSSILFGLMIFATFPSEWRANQRRFHLEERRKIRFSIFSPSILLSNLFVLITITLLRLLYTPLECGRRE